MIKQRRNKMSEEVIVQAAEEIKNADEEKLKETIKKWYDKTHTQGLRMGASYISAVVYGAYQKHIATKQSASLRDYKRFTDEVIGIVSKQLVREGNKENTEEIENE
jgi:transcription initiation factor TFIIIB Brf1 subunit/transcription initiation factor TFIIB